MNLGVIFEKEEIAEKRRGTRPEASFAVCGPEAIGASNRFF
jgi:hypothetical protein